MKATSLFRVKDMGAPDFLQGGGEMGALMRAHDWSKSSLGDPSGWPQTLRTAVRLMLTTGHPVYIWWGADGACLYNDAYRQSIGPERHPSSLGRPAREVWDEIWDIIGPQIAQVMEGRGPTWNENHLVPITRNGKREDVYWTYSYGPIDDSSAPNGVGGVLVLCTETTQQVLSLQRLSEERARFAALFELAPTFMAMLEGPDHRIEMINPGWTRLMGHHAGVGRTIAEVLPGAIAQSYVALLDRVYQSGTAFAENGAKFVVQADPSRPSEERYVDFVCQPLRDGTGAVTGLFLEGVDVTERIRANAAAQRLASIVESSDDGIISKDLDGTIRSWNKGAERLYGYSAEEAIGRPVTMLIPADYQHEEPEIMARIVKGERVDHYETVRRRKDGTLFHISLTVSPVRDDSGTIIGASKVARDITESKKAKEKLGLLLREMNHRIKNLFAIASGVVALSRRSAATPKELADTVLSRLGALARAHDLVLPQGPNFTEVRKAQVSELIGTILSPYNNENGNIAISGPQLECSPSASTSLALLLHEFATNSVKYGALSTVSGRLDIQWSIDNALVLTWSEDNGVPIEPAAKEQGFGGVMVEATVAGLGGTIERVWHDAGLSIRVAIPLERLVAR